jgi:hypothetical protein
MDITSPVQPVEHSQLPLAGVLGRPPWREVLYAGVPHLWLGIAVALGKIVGTNNNLVSDVSAASLVLFLIFSAGVAAYAWRHGWPLWTAAWYSYAFWLLVVAVLSLIYLSGLYLLGENNWILNAVMLLGSIAAIGLGYLVLFRYSRLHALLVALFLLPVASQLGLEAIPDVWEAFIALFFGLLAALASAYIVWSLSWSRGVTAALLANLFAGAALTYISFYQTEIPGFYGDTFAEALQAFLGFLGVAAALFLGPWIFWGGWDILKGKLR